MSGEGRIVEAEAVAGERAGAHADGNDDRRRQQPGGDRPPAARLQQLADPGTVARGDEHPAANCAEPNHRVERHPVQGEEPDEHLRAVDVAEHGKQGHEGSGEHEHLGETHAALRGPARQQEGHPEEEEVEGGIGGHPSWMRRAAADDRLAKEELVRPARPRGAPASSEASAKALRTKHTAVFAFIVT